jgi:hypothetical protein
MNVEPQPCISYENYTCVVVHTTDALVTLVPCYSSTIGTIECPYNDAKLRRVIQKYWPPDNRQQEIIQEWRRSHPVQETSLPEEQGSLPEEHSEHKPEESSTPPNYSFSTVLGTGAVLALAAPRIAAMAGSRFGGAAALTHGLKLIGCGIGMSTGIGVIAGVSALAGGLAMYLSSSHSSGNSDSSSNQNEIPVSRKRKHS